jgi:predicted transcriptional regulator of viral defense system
VQKGELRKLERGLYTPVSMPASEHISLLEVTRKVPKAVICLLSALRFHEIGTQTPNEVWIALGAKAWAPKISSPAVRIVRFSGKAFHFGIEEKKVSGGKIRVYALEALRDCYRQKKASIDELWEAAKVCRVTNVIKPYLESLR